MRQFSDATGARWTIHFTVGALKRIKAATGVDMMEPAAEIDGLPLYIKLRVDLSLLSAVLFAAIGQEAETRGVTADAWDERMEPAILALAQTALEDEWLDFFLKLNRPEAAQAIQAGGKLVRGAIQKAATILSERADKSVSAALEDFGRSLTASLESLESPRTASPSVS